MKILLVSEMQDLSSGLLGSQQILCYIHSKGVCVCVFVCMCVVPYEVMFSILFLISQKNM